MNIPRARPKPSPPALLFYQDLGARSTTSVTTASPETAKSLTSAMLTWQGTLIINIAEMKKPPTGMMGILMPHTSRITI